MTTDSKASDVEAREIAACPFCGHAKAPAVHPASKVIRDYPDGFMVVCDAATHTNGFVRRTDIGCGASSGWADTEPEAIARWNARASQQPSAQWIAVSERLPEANTTVLLFYRNALSKGRIVRGFWCPKFSREMSSYGDFEEGGDYDEEKDQYFWPEGWFEEVDNWDDYSAVAISAQISHWQLLPPSPDTERNSL